jgi:hypothetical protein
LGVEGTGAGVTILPDDQQALCLVAERTADVWAIDNFDAP